MATEYAQKVGVEWQPDTVCRQPEIGPLALAADAAAVVAIAITSDLRRHRLPLKRYAPPPLLLPAEVTAAAHYFHALQTLPFDIAIRHCQFRASLLPSYISAPHTTDTPLPQPSLNSG